MSITNQNQLNPIHANHTCTCNNLDQHTITERAANVIGNFYELLMLLYAQFEPLGKAIKSVIIFFSMFCFEWYKSFDFCTGMFVCTGHT